MKAILFVFVFYAGESTHSQSVEMPTMQGCVEAAVVLNGAEMVRRGLRGNALVFAVCVERK